MNLTSPTIWFLGVLGLGYLIAQLLIFVLLIYALENKKIDVSDLGAIRIGIIKVMNLAFGLGFGFLFLSGLLVRASREYLTENYDLVPLTVTGSSFIFFVTIAAALKIFKKP